MASLILHHYELSPFSEKMRAMFGYVGLDWLSVQTTEIPPRPLLAPLAGGYRRIPVAQIGADVFCDTRTITTEVARLTGNPELTLEHCSDEQRAFVGEADLELFFACILSTATLRPNRKLLGAFSLPMLLRFAWDRVQLGRSANVPKQSPKQARERVRAHLQRLDDMLQHDFLYGDTPTLADFSAYHGLWFVRDVAEQPATKHHPRVEAWMDRIAAFGHGRRSELPAEEALDVARQAEPRPVPESAHPWLGRSVRIAPSDYGQVPVTGTLRADTTAHWIVGRDDPRCGNLHVHFPKQGFDVDLA